MRVLVADKLSQDSLDEIKLLGVDLVYEPDLEPALLRHALDGVGALVVRGKPVDAATIEGAPALSLIVRAGAGTGAIDVAAASARGIYVTHCPGRNASAVVELTTTLIGCLDRRVPDAVLSLRGGHWEKHEFAQARGLAGRRLGIAGLGPIGRGVARVGQALGMKVHAWSRSLGASLAAELDVIRHDSLVELARHSDVFSVHLALGPRTQGVVSRAVIEALPQGASFVNTARHELVDYEALLALVPEKALRVALDVLPGEPSERQGKFHSKLLDAGLVYATPHIGASTDAAQNEICAETVRILRAFLNEGEVPNVVNIAATSRARYQLVVRHRDKVGALANVLGVLKRHGINIQELDNTVFEGGRAGCAKIRLDHRPSEACLTEIMAFSDEVLHVHLVQLPNLA
jgi:D-3-phosphoglycerate dehydrogenase / 2-oxoglutarate reductase